MPTAPQFAAAVERVSSLPLDRCAVCGRDLNPDGRCSFMAWAHRGRMHSITEATRIVREAKGACPEEDGECMPHHTCKVECCIRPAVRHGCCRECVEHADRQAMRSDGVIPHEDM